MNNNMTHKVLLCSYFLLVSMALLSIRNITTQGYEVSIYDSLPSTFYLFMLIPLVLSCIFIFNSLFKRNHYTHFLTFAYFLLAELIIFSFILLPHIKNYAFYPLGDVTTHLGFIFDIVSFGYVDRGLIYPVVHIFATMIHYVAGTSITNVTMAMKPIYIIFYMLFIFVLSRYISQNFEKSIFVTLIASLIVSKIQQTPGSLSSLVLILIFYLYFRSKDSKTHNNIKFKVLLLILILLYPFFHPLTCLILIFSLVVMDFYNILYILNNSCRLHTSLDNTIFSKISLSSIILLIVFLLWIWNHFWYWDSQFGPIFKWIFGATTSDFSRSSNIISILDRHNINPIELVLKNYIGNFIILTGNLFVILKLYKNVLFGTDLKNNKENEILFILSGVAFVLAIFLLFSQFVSTTAGPQRFVSYMTVVTQIYFVYFISGFRRFIAKFIIMLLILLITFSSIFGMHPSNITLLPNVQVTELEIEGMQWLISYKNDDYGSLYNHERPYRIADLILGRKSAIENGISRSMSQKPPDHFGYRISDRIGNFYSSNNYLILEKYDEVLYFDLYASSNLFTMSDFEKLENDLSTRKLYENNEFKVYLISPNNCSSIPILL